MRRAIAFTSARKTPGVWVADGNSIMAGAFLLTGEDPPAQAAPLVHGNFTYYNAALSGQDVGGPFPSGSASATPPGTRQMTIPEADLGTRPRAWADSFVVKTAHWGPGCNGARNVISMHDILNDVLGGGASADDAIARIKTYVAAKRRAGFNRIVLSTSIGYLPVDTTNNAKLVIIRDWIYSPTSRPWRDSVADYWGRVPECQDATNSTYFQTDQVHPKAPLAALMGVELARAINEAIGLPDPPG